MGPTPDPTQAPAATARDASLTSVLAALVGRDRFAPALPELTQRERQIVDLVAHGLGNIAVARQLSLSEKTVRNQLSAILAKLGARDRAELIARGRAVGLGR